MGNRRTDAELRAMHAEKQAALTERMAVKADPRIKAARQLEANCADLLRACESEFFDGRLSDHAETLRDACLSLDATADFLVRQWADKEARGEA